MDGVIAKLEKIITINHYSGNFQNYLAIFRIYHTFSRHHFWNHLLLFHVRRQNQNKNNFLSKWNFKILHDLEIQKSKFWSLKINEHYSAWHLFWHHISSKWSWFQAFNWPVNLQKIQIKFLQLWHHQGCVMIFFIRGEIITE